MSARFADVALAVPSGGLFQYEIPEALIRSIRPGQRAFVPMRNRRMVGTVVSLSEQPVVGSIKPLDGLVDEDPVVDERMLALTRWIADYYACSWGQAIDAALPGSFKKGRHVMKSRKSASTSASAVRTQPLDLTDDQRTAYRSVADAMAARRHETFLLHGVTGSGKTEVYMHLIRDLLAEGRSSIVLVPEISLTPQTVDRFVSRFGECVAVIHSRLSQGRRSEEWRRIREGKAKVVVGARSALFSPMRDLGLIILDEEHETSYKQEEAPRYHAREVAIERARIENAVVLLGSATPSLEAYRAATSGRFKLLHLARRIEDRPLPIVEIVDMRRQRQDKRERIFSVPLETSVRDALHRKEQTMLLLNRRGFSTYLHCSSCGYVMTCPNCRISLTYHYDKAVLLCHVCHHEAQTQRLCPGCQKNYLHYFGTGTQKVEQETKRLFPDARVARMDTDSTSRKDAHESILTAFRRHEIDILIGTQMIAKGHDFPNVSLIGVISADTALHIPDFRSSERTFDLLTQVAGRAGRGDIPGKVLIQTLLPHHYAIQSAKDHDFHEFYDKEIVLRRELSMPPFASLVRVILRGPDEKIVVRQALECSKILRGLGSTDVSEVLGPAPCVSSKEHGQYHWNLFLKGPAAPPMVALLAEALKSARKGGVTAVVDVDPI